MVPLRDIEIPKPIPQKLLIVVIFGMFVLQTVIFNKMIHGVRTDLSTYTFVHKTNPEENHMEIDMLEKRVTTLEKEINILLRTHKND